MEGDVSGCEMSGSIDALHGENEAAESDNEDDDASDGVMAGCDTVAEVASRVETQLVQECVSPESVLVGERGRSCGRR
jgi:hypothetical protein